MSNSLAINVTAADRATKVLNDINKRANQMTRPLQNMERSLKQFGKAAGLDTLKGKLEGMTRTVRRTADAFTKIGAPLAALIGGGTIAGLLALTDGWARFGLQVSQTAQILGVDTQALYDFQNASRLVGISGDAATQTFQSFADTLQDARWGRNQAAYSLLIGLGVQLKTTKAGAIDSMDALGQVADKIQALQKAGNTGGARTIARQLGITSLMPFLMQGRKGMEALEAQAHKLAGMMDWKAAREAGLQWGVLNVAMENTKNTIAAALLPTVTPLITQFGSWIQTNRQLIATDLTDFLKGLGAAFKGLTLKEVLDDVLGIVKAMGSLADNVAKVTGDVGGLKRVLEGLGLLWAIPKVAKIAKGAAVGSAFGGKVVGAVGKAVAGDAGAAVLGGIGSLAAPVAIGLAANSMWNGRIGKLDFNSWGGLFNSMKSTKAHAQQVMSFFQGQGWTAAQAAGITANIQAESGYDPAAVGDNGDAYGIGQWHPDRQAAFNAWAAQNNKPELSRANMLEQMQFYDYELKHSAAGKKLAGAKTAGEAGRIVSLYDERPAGDAAEASARGALATQIAGSAPALSAAPAAPQVNVSVQNTIHANGAATTRVQTPSGVKIVHTNPVAAVS